MDNLPIQPINPRETIIVKRLAVQRKREEKNTHLKFQKEIITVFPEIIHFLLTERGRKMMTTSKENFER